MAIDDLRYGSITHRLLGVACATPREIISLAATAEARYGELALNDTSYRRAAGQLVERGFLRREERKNPRGVPTVLYAVTDKGEMYLEYLDEQAGVA